jgi:hypothetical protein
MDVSQPVAVIGGISRVNTFAASLIPKIIKGYAHSKSSDIYALGIMMWMLFTKKPELTEDVYRIKFYDNNPHVLLAAVVSATRPPVGVTDGFPKAYETIMKR